jgi:hypothetical protein
MSSPSFPSPLAQARPAGLARLQRDPARQRTYQTRGPRRSQVSTAVQVHRGANSATSTSPPGPFTSPRWRPYPAWRISVQDTASGTRIAGLMRPWLLFWAAAFTHRNQPYRLVGPRAAHGSGGVHRPRHDPTTPKQKFCRLDEAAVAIPPGPKHLRLLPGHGMGQRAGEPSARHFPCLRQGVDAGGINGGPKRF